MICGEALVVAEGADLPAPNLSHMEADNGIFMDTGNNGQYNNIPAPNTSAGKELLVETGKGGKFLAVVISSVAFALATLVMMSVAAKVLPHIIISSMLAMIALPVAFIILYIACKNGRLTNEKISLANGLILVSLTITPILFLLSLFAVLDELGELYKAIFLLIVLVLVSLPLIVWLILCIIATISVSQQAKKELAVELPVVVMVFNWITFAAVWLIIFVLLFMDYPFGLTALPFICLNILLVSINICIGEHNKRYKAYIYKVQGINPQ